MYNDFGKSFCIYRIEQRFFTIIKMWAQYKSEP